MTSETPTQSPLYRLASRPFIWLFQAVHRWLSALFMLGIMGLEWIMHVLSIPHLEGWWVPMLGGSVFVSAGAAWFHKWRNRDKD